MKITKENVFDLAIAGNPDVLQSPLADQISDYFESTPLHYLADKICDLVLQHPSVDKVKDGFGNTPLHLLAANSTLKSKNLEILNHPSIDQIRNHDGQVPIQLINPILIPRKWFKEKYPNINITGKRITKKIVDLAVNASNAERFIFNAAKEERKSKISIP